MMTVLLNRLEQQFKTFSSLDLILIGGDFNSRTGTEQRVTCKTISLALVFRGAAQ